MRIDNLPSQFEYTTDVQIFLKGLKLLLEKAGIKSEVWRYNGAWSQVTDSYYDVIRLDADHPAFQFTIAYIHRRIPGKGSHRAWFLDEDYGFSYINFYQLSILEATS